MTPDHPIDDDALATILADAVVDAVVAKHPSADRLTRKRLARLYLAQLLGTAPPRGSVSQSRLAKVLGTSNQRLSEMESTLIHKLRASIQP